MRLEKILPKENLDLINEIDKVRVPEHVAIIMDGNGRWATKKGLPRSSGHNEGVNVLKEIVKVSKNIGIKVLTFMLFPLKIGLDLKKEVDFLIKLFQKVITNEIEEIHKKLIKIKFIGDLAPFPESLKSLIKQAETLTDKNQDFILNICINYGGRQEIVKVARKIALKSISGEIDPNNVNEKLFESELLTKGSKDPELLIRTSGEKG